MKRTSKIPLQTDALKGPGWLIFFYSVPSKPVNNRVKIWRRLAKAGAISLKGAVYMLPYSEENFEFFTWLSSEVVSIGGEGAFVMADKIETMKNDEIIRLFNQQRERDYHTIEKGLEDLERRINSIRKGTGIQNNKLLLERFNKHLKEFGEIKKIDFFSSKTGNVLKSRIEVIRAGIRGIAGTDIRKQQVAVVPKQIKDYQGRIWVTRKNPFVDRMASAWLIKSFIDNNAVFKFIDERDMENLGKGMVAFDIRGGDFTHIGDMCTFEVLMKTFGLKTKALRKISEIVHELDIKDDKYSSQEANGIEHILMGIRKIAKNDIESLERGMAVFEMLYASKT